MTVKLAVREIVMYAIEWYGWTQIAPTFTLQQVVFIVHPSWFNLGLTVIAFLIDSFFHTLADFAITTFVNFNLWQAIKKIKGYRIVAIQLDTLVASEGQKEFFRGVYQPERFGKRSYLKLVAEPIWSQIRAFAVLPIDGAAPLDKQTAYQDLNGCCTIFLPAESLTAYQRFVLLHEIGHATKNNALQRSRLAGWPVSIMFCLWSLVMCSHTLKSLAVVAACLALQIYVRRSWKESPGNLDEATLLNELFADYFAVCYADIADITVVEGLLTRKAHLIKDAGLSENMNSTRQTKLLENLRRRISGLVPISPKYQTLPSLRLFLTYVGSSVFIAFAGQVGSRWTLPWLIGVVIVIIFLVCNQASINEDIRQKIKMHFDGWIPAARAA